MAVKELLRRPVAGAESVEDLVARVLRGEVRIPVFQRGIKWDAKNVVELFDSIYRGYPIGSLLLRAAPAQAAQVRIGPLVIPGEELERALWVVDGQQRLTSLAVGLGRDDEFPRVPSTSDPFAVYFDPTDETFCSPRTDGQISSSWIPLPRLLDASGLSEWVFTAWSHGHDATLRAVVFEAGKRLREYQVPFYVVETADEAEVRRIFDRVNTSGVRLSGVDVFDALFGHPAGAPSTIAELAGELESLGMGIPDEQAEVLPSLVALRGLDVTRPFWDHAREHPEAFQSVAAEGAPILRKVLGFLRAHAEIPHLRLLPHSAPMIVLARFFALHPEPNERTQTLLVRWVWRTFFSPVRNALTLRRQGVAVLSADDEEASVQALLRLVDCSQPPRFVVPEHFHGGTAASRLVLLGLAALKPREITDDHDQRGQLVDLARLEDGFRSVFPGPGRAHRSPANRVLLRGSGAAHAELLALVVSHGADHPLLRSHAIDPGAADALCDGDDERFVARRTEAIAAAVDDLATRLAAWERTDRPSIDYLLAQVGSA